jgi:VTC domain
MAAELEDLTQRFDGVSLPELDERAALLKRVDRKYAVDAARFRELSERLCVDHQILDIDGRRVFRYRSAYFDTPDLRCFWDHVDDRVPRFKARTRTYEDSARCVFEVKLTRAPGETDKRQVDHVLGEARQLTDDAWRCLREALGDAGLECPDSLSHTLTTSFERLTLAAAGRADRLTCDARICLASPRGQTVTLRDGVVLVETKSEDGDGPADRALANLEVQAISLSKYRVGTSLVGQAGDIVPQPGSDLFA